MADPAGGLLMGFEITTTIIIIIIEVGKQQFVGLG